MKNTAASNPQLRIHLAAASVVRLSDAVSIRPWRDGVAFAVSKTQTEPQPGSPRTQRFAKLPPGFGSAAECAITLPGTNESNVPMRVFKSDGSCDGQERRRWVNHPAGPAVLDTDRRRYPEPYGNALAEWGGRRLRHASNSSVTYGEWLID
mgnify:CR=1 FL=1